MHSFQADCEWFSRSWRLVRNHCLFEHALLISNVMTKLYEECLDMVIYTNIN
ncbi:hypothetical protein SAMN05421736_103144 [Evansella caseinilytica]|uniref:Uncharacterized protein n=1 Tax=Evansella caseinilytica TaxID=1503961 RepID=A0A1H3M940_9BACI|nr:hypothetical protein SAMN05421736_103144 [Evansella caseinilytica]